MKKYKYKNKKVTAVVLARLLSNRLKKCKKVDEIILATSSAYHDRVFRKIAKNHKIKFFSGSENDVLDRLNQATSHLDPADIIVRANADNPIFMPTIVDTDIKKFKKLNFEVFSPFFKNKLPFGYSFTIFKIAKIHNRLLTFF